MVAGGVVSPDTCTAGILVASSGHLGCPELGFGVICDMIKRGSRPNALLLTALINGLFKEGSIGDAVEVFVKMREWDCDPDVVCFNTVIRFCCREMGMHSLGFGVLCDMIKRGYSADVITFNTLIDGLCKKGKLRQAISVLRRMPVMECTPTTVTYNTLLGCLFSGVNDRVETRLTIFCEMFKGGYPADTVTFNCLLNCLCKSGHTVEASAMFHRMPEIGCEHDVVSYVALIDSFCNTIQVNLGFATFCHMVKHGYNPNTVVLSVLLNGVCREGRIVEAAVMFQKMSGMIECQPNSITYGILIDCCCRLGKVDIGFGWFSDMLKSGHQTNALILTSLLNGLSDLNRLSDAANLLRKMINAESPTITATTYGSIINAVCRAGQFDLGFGVLCSMLKLGHPANNVILNSIVHGFCMARKVVSAASLVARMPSLGYIPDVVTLSSLINGLCKTGSVEVALDLYESMKQIGNCCEPNLITYNTLIAYLCNKGQMDKSLEIVQEMKTRGVFPNAFTYRCIIRGFSNLGHWEKAVWAFETMVIFGLCPEQQNTYKMKCTKEEEKEKVATTSKQDFLY